MNDNLTASKAIRTKCMDCAGEQALEVTLCHITDCALWPRRMGTSSAALTRFNKAKIRSKDVYKLALEYADDPVKFAMGVPPTAKRSAEHLKIARSKRTKPL